MTTGAKFILETLNAGRAQDSYLLNIKLLTAEMDKRCINKPLFKAVTTHENYIKKYYKPVIPMVYEFQSLQAETGDIGFNTTNVFSLMQYGDFICEMLLEVRIAGLSVVNNLDRCGFYDFLGHRLMKKTQMEFAGNVIDEYSSEVYNIFYNQLPHDKRLQWNRMIGQETAQEVFIQQDPLDNYRERKTIVNGPQTPKQQHGEIIMHIPIILGFTQKLHTSIFSAKIPHGQRYLKIDTCDWRDLVYVQDNGGGGALNAPSITGRLWVNNVFVDPQIRQALMPGQFRNLIRVYKEQKISANLVGSVRLDQLRYPIEHVYFGMRPTANDTATTWWRFHTCATEPVTFPVRLATGTVPANQLAWRTADLITPQMPLTSVMFTSQSAEIIHRNTSEFYQTQHYLKSVSPQDPGLLLYSFARDTMTDEPTSYYNTSTLREFNINFTSNTTGDIYVLTICLNWMVINELGQVTLLFNS